MGTLRFYLAMGVAFSHSLVLTSDTLLLNGFVAVTIFFIISGFTISYILRKKYSDRKLLFLKNRFLRVFVPFVLVATGIEVSYFLFSNSTKIQLILDSNFSPFQTVLALFSNIFLFGANWVAIVGADLQEGLVIPQSWSLPLELSFYLIVPFIINSKLKKIVLFSLSLFFYIFLINMNKINLLNFLFLSNLPFFMLGVFSCDIMLKLKLVDKLNKIQSLKNYNKMIYLFIIFFLILLNYIAVKTNISDGLSDKFNLIFLNLVISCILPLIFCITINLNLQFRALDNLLGKLSYHIYLIHVFMYLTLLELKIILINPAFTYILFLIIFSYFSFKLANPIEQKLRYYFK